MPLVNRHASGLQWYCLRSQQKREHIAAIHLTRHLGLEVFAPRVSLTRRTRQGPARFTEALFPSYLFARFDLSTHLSAVRASWGVQDVVRFGEQPPLVAESVIHELMAQLGGKSVWIMPELPQPGEQVQLCGGALDRSWAEVLTLREGNQRVRVLLEFLGRQTIVEVPLSSVLVSTQHPLKAA